MDSSSSCPTFNVEEEVVVIRNEWTPKKEKKKVVALIAVAADIVAWIVVELLGEFFLWHCR